KTPFRRTSQHAGPDSVFSFCLRASDLVSYCDEGPSLGSFASSSSLLRLVPAGRKTGGKCVSQHCLVGSKGSGPNHQALNSLASSGASPTSTPKYFFHSAAPNGFSLPRK